MSLPTVLAVTQRIEKFFSQFQAFDFSTGEVLIRSGEKLNWIYYLTSGVVKQTATSAEGQELIITLYKSGAFFPLIWALKDVSVPYDFHAAADGRGWKAPKEAVIEFLQKDAEVSFHVCTRLLSGLEGLSRKIEYALQTNASCRVGEALLTLASRLGSSTASSKVVSSINFSELSIAPVQIRLSLTHQELARLTGLTRETVTRELQGLKQMGLVKIEKQTFILTQPTMLAQLVGLG